MEIPRHWRIRQQRYALVGDECYHCKGKIFPPREICPYCGGEVKVSGTTKGEVYSYTILRDAPDQLVPEPVPQAQDSPVMSR